MLFHHEFVPLPDPAFQRVHSSENPTTVIGCWRVAICYHTTYGLEEYKYEQPSQEHMFVSPIRGYSRGTKKRIDVPTRNRRKAARSSSPRRTSRWSMVVQATIR